MNTNLQIKLLNFQEQPIRQITDERGEPWFLGADVCEILGLSSGDNVSKHLRALPENEKLTLPVVRSGQRREMLFVNEPGLYRLIFQSRKPEAEAMKTWVFHEVLPSLRKHGYYIARKRSLDAEFDKLIPARQEQILNWLEVFEKIDVSANKTEAFKQIADSHSGIKGWKVQNVTQKYYRWLKSGRDWKMLDAYRTLYRK